MQMESYGALGVVGVCWMTIGPALGWIDCCAAFSCHRNVHFCGVRALLFLFLHALFTLWANNRRCLLATTEALFGNPLGFGGADVIGWCCTREIIDLALEVEAIFPAVDAEFLILAIA
jgi:hypothetical protein